MMMSKHLAKLLGAVTAVVVAMVVVAAPVLADTPAPGYTQFAGCPSLNENPTVTLCQRTTITGGHFKMGSKKVPIANPMTLSGGLTSSGAIVATSKGGLTPVKQKVPGGVIGLTGLTWLAELLGSEALTLYAVTELAGQPSLGEDLRIPIKVHLINGTLGNNCYVGSTSNPIVLHLTNEETSPPPPNMPIEGKFPEVSVDEANKILHLDNGIYVDNEFAAPGASGCVLTLFGFIPVSINGLVNSQSGLPAPAGTNETIQEYDTEATSPEIVYP